MPTDPTTVFDDDIGALKPDTIALVAAQLTQAQMTLEAVTLATTKSARVRENAVETTYQRFVTMLKKGAR